METKDLMYIVKKSYTPPQDELEALHKLRIDLDKWTDSRALAYCARLYVAGKVMGVRQERQRRRNRREVQ